MALYEHIFIARQDISAQQAETLMDDYAALIREHGGIIGRTEYWGLRPLAYRIKKNRKGHYILMDIDSSHDAVAEMERQMRFNDDVIRFLTVRVQEHEGKPSVQMTRREERRSPHRESFSDDSNGNDNNGETVSADANPALEPGQ
ncbi:MAG: 30S ribosomal protein S6 [Parvularculales bacterium]